MEPRPYQTECIDSKFDYWASNPGKFSIDVLPTAAGKTFIAGKLLERLFTEYPGNQCVFLAHRKELISQTEKTILSVWPDAPIGVYAAGLKRKQIAPIVVASRDTLAPAMKTLSLAPSMVLIDECHNVSDKEGSRYQKLIREFRARNRHFNLNGTTATPFRHNHGYIYGEGQIFDDVSYQVRMRTLLDAGYLAPLVTPAVDPSALINTDGLKLNANNHYNENQLAERAINLELIEASINEWIRLAVKTGRRHTLFFCVNIRHAQAVQAELSMRGYNFPLVTGDTDPEVRDRICREFLAGLHSGILNVGVFTEGTDFPLIDCIVNLRSVRSLPLWLQMAGRGMRTSEDTGKKDCLLLDMGGCLDHFGPIDTATPPSKGEPDKRTKECPECSLVVGYLKRRCQCGFEFQPPLMKICPECTDECAPSAAECAACGYIFFKHEKLASTASALSGSDRFVRHPISEPVKYLMKTSRVTNENYLQLQYKSGTSTFNHNLHIGAEGVAGHKALEHWKNAVYPHVAVPGDVSEAIRLLGSDDLSSMSPGKVFFTKTYEPKESSALRGVASIVVDSKSKYKNISVFTYYEKPND